MRRRRYLISALLLLALSIFALATFDNSEFYGLSDEQLDQTAQNSNY